MQNLKRLTSKGKENFANLVDLGKQQPEQVQTWGITVASALVGAVAFSAAAHGVVAVLATLATPPVALIVGALGGGFVGWSYLQNRKTDAIEPSNPAANRDAANSEMAGSTLSADAMQAQPTN